jgi:sec-independent protein translocase protein TatC
MEARFQEYFPVWRSKVEGRKSKVQNAFVSFETGHITPMPAPADSDPDPELRSSKPMGFWDHLEELRGTIIKSVVVFVLFAGLIGYYLTEFNELLQLPFTQVAAEYPQYAFTLGTNTMSEGFNAIMQLCLYGGLLLAAPFILFFIGQFVAPALTERETKAVAPLCGAALVLFLAGAIFGYLVLVPATLQVNMELHILMKWEPRLTVGSYYGTLTGFVLGVGAVFEFPLLVVLLVWLGLLNTATLRKYRRHAMVLIVVIAAVVTPTTDPTIQALLAAPLYLLYEIAILAASWVEKRRERSAAAVLLALMALWPRRSAVLASVRGDNRASA